MKTYFYKEKFDITDVQTKITLPNLRSITVINKGDYDVYLEFENDVTDDSIPIFVGGNVTYSFSPLDVRLKCATGQTATVYITGLKHIKE